MVNLKKAAIIGLGNVGASIAFHLMTTNLFSELVLIDIAKDKAEGEAYMAHDHAALLNHIKADMPSDELLQDLGDLFKIFGDTTRIKIMYALYEDEMCVCAIADLLGMTQSAISHQLKVLKAANLVESRRDGKTIYYSLADDHVKSIIAQGYEHLTE